MHADATGPVTGSTSTDDSSIGRTDDTSPEGALTTSRDLPLAQRRQARDRVVVDHLWLARSLAHRYRDRGEGVDDLEQVACLGLVKAADHYRPGEGHSFAAYAVPTITGELRRHFRDKGWDVRPPRRLQELRSRLREAELTLSQELMRTATAAELADRLGVSADELDEARQASAGYSSVSLDAPAPGGADTRAWADVLPAQDEPTDVDASVSVRPLLAQLPERDQRILALRFFRGLTQQQIADDIGVTQMQVSRLLTRVLQQLRSEVEADQGVTA